MSVLRGFTLSVGLSLAGLRHVRHGDGEQQCKLTKAEVIALRFYTTSGFKNVNTPLRDYDRLKRGEPHPLPIMVWLLQYAVKKIRTQAAN